MTDLLAVRLDLEALRERVDRWMITRHNDVPEGWTVVSAHGDYVGLVETMPRLRLLHPKEFSPSVAPRNANRK